MKTILKTTIGTLVTGLLLTVSSGNAAAAYGCVSEFRACVAAGIDIDICRDQLWLCKYGYLPAKSAAQMIPGDRRY
ncbi:MAG: hypothetical protein HOP03_15870 [Lysobacter sp.]|nr:hypothetical protein [Lysobacter sp.]